MSESLEKVRGVRRLPIFPLGVVLFPGVPLPLHIFEPRYRAMLSDVCVGNNFFGVSYFNSGETGVDRPPVGHIGCVAEVVEAQQLSDGRSNILTIGLVRYRATSYVETDDPYLVAEVEFFEDEHPDQPGLGDQARQVAELFGRIARAIRTINDDRATRPELPDTVPERLSFVISAAIEMNLEIKQELLELRSTTERLTRLENLLSKVVDGYEERARVHAIAKGNGHGGKSVNLDE